MPPKAQPMVIHSLKIEQHPEFGRIVTFECPDCKGQLAWHEWGKHQDKHECKCRTWNLIIEARGLGK